MKRRKTVVAAGFCLSFFMGTLVNLLFVPGFDPPAHRSRQPGGDALEPAAAELHTQIRERSDEVLRYRRRRAHWDGTGVAARPLERRRLMDLEHEWEPGERDDTPGVSAHRDPALGCGSIDNVTNVRYLGSGYTKAVYRAALNGSFSVALKSVDFGGHDMENCVKKYASSKDCYKLASFKIVKEMTLMDRLQHPNILKVMFAYIFIYEKILLTHFRLAAIDNIQITCDYFLQLF